MQINEAEMRRLERSVIARLSHVMEPAVRSAIMEAFHGGRRTQNGVMEPGPGKCRDVWDALDALDTPSTATLVQVLAIADSKGFNHNSARVQYYRWRTFNRYNLAH